MTSDLDAIDDYEPAESGDVVEPRQPTQGVGEVRYDQDPLDPQLAVPVDTGDPRVDEALKVLRELDQAYIAEHPRVFDQVHRALQDAMLTLDQD
ncbi:unannotated protein [freshwater metagenome]|uniref:Unannotated protein n=1 Tax=freshwater metagenome TaxID=449393 RepID=A0A6J7E624_9ZZZZ|nr:hypothetical protein [Actinomycetota bacterium]